MVDLLLVEFYSKFPCFLLPGKYEHNAFRKQHHPICRGAQKQKVH